MAQFKSHDPELGLDPPGKGPKKHHKLTLSSLAHKTAHVSSPFKKVFSPLGTWPLGSGTLTTPLKRGNSPRNGFVFFLKSLKTRCWGNGGGG